MYRIIVIYIYVEYKLGIETMPEYLSRDPPLMVLRINNASLALPEFQIQPLKSKKMQQNESGETVQVKQILR